MSPVGPSRGRENVDAERETHAGCQPIGTLTFSSLDERYFGELTEIQRIDIGEKHFLHFAHDTRPFHTLLLCANDEQALLELKVNSPEPLLIASRPS